MKTPLLIFTLLVSTWASAMTVHRPGEMSYGSSSPESEPEKQYTWNRPYPLPRDFPRNFGTYACHITPEFKVACGGDLAYVGQGRGFAGNGNRRQAESVFHEVQLPGPVKALATGTSQVIVLLDSGLVLNWKGLGGDFETGPTGREHDCKAKNENDLTECVRKPGYLSLPERAKTVAVGGRSSACALLEKSKEVWCWGGPSHPSHPYKESDSRNGFYMKAPRRTPIPGEAMTIEGNENGFFVLLKDGRVYAFGRGGSNEMRARTKEFPGVCHQNQSIEGTRNQKNNLTQACFIPTELPVRMIAAGAYNEPACFLLEDGKFVCQGEGNPDRAKRLAIEKEQGFGSFHWSLAASHTLREMADFVYTRSPPGILYQRAAAYFDKSLAAPGDKPTPGQLLFWNALNVAIQLHTSEIVQKRYALMLKNALGAANAAMGAPRGLQDIPRTPETAAVALNLLALALEACKSESAEAPAIAHLQAAIGRALAAPSSWDPLVQAWTSSTDLFNVLTSRPSTRNVMELIRQIGLQLGLTPAGHA